MMLGSGFTERRAKRLPLQLPIRIEAQTAQDVVWREITHLVNVSPLGAAFYANHKLSVGQVVLLTIPLPRGLRSFDYGAEQYNVWSIVRYSNPPTGGNPKYTIGVAFIGKEPPASYRENPSRLYKVSGISGDGLWQIGEDSRPLFDRRHERYHIPLNIYLAVFDRENKIVAQETTVTENISRGGASVFSALPVKVGDAVKVGCEQFDGFLNAEVRHLRTGEDGLPRLHLKFIGAEFPLEGIERF